MSTDGDCEPIVPAYQDLLQAAFDGDEEFLSNIRDSVGYTAYHSEIAIVSLQLCHVTFWLDYIYLSRCSLVYPASDHDYKQVQFTRDLVYTDVMKADLHESEIVLDLFKVIAEDLFPGLPTNEEAEQNPVLSSKFDRLFGNESAARIWSDGSGAHYTFNQSDVSLAALFAIDSENYELLEYFHSNFDLICTYEHLMRASRTFNQRIYSLVRKNWTLNRQSRRRSKPTWKSFLKRIMAPSSFAEQLMPPPCDFPGKPQDGDFIWKVLMAAERGSMQFVLNFLTSYPIFARKLPDLIAFLEALMASPDGKLPREIPRWFQDHFNDQHRDPVIFAHDVIEVCNELVRRRGKPIKPKPLEFHSDPIHIRVQPGYYKGTGSRCCFCRNNYE